jgi:uncharacterized membrane protein
MITKTMIAPFVASAAIAAQLIFGINIPEDVVNQTVAVIVNAALVITTIVGIVKNHQK